MSIRFQSSPLLLLTMLVMSFRMETPGTTAGYAAAGHAAPGSGSALRPTPGPRSAPRPVAGPGPEISIVTDDTAGVSALHGLEKLTTSLTSRHIGYEKITDPRQARGKYLLAAGLAYGNGTAATL